MSQAPSKRIAPKTSDQSSRPLAPQPELARPSSSDRTALFALAGAVIAATIAYVASNYATKSAFDAKMVEIGVSILAADPSKSDVTPARQWAIDLVEKHSGEPFNAVDKSNLLHHPLTFFVGNSPLSLVAAGCAAWRKNPDGSWTQTGRIVTPGNNAFEGNTLKNTGETRLLDQLCTEHP